MIVSAQKSLTQNEFKVLPQLQEMYDKARLIEPLITDDLCELSDTLHTTWQGLEYAVKTPNSIEDKVERTVKNTGAQPETVFSNMRDVIRYTQICEPRDIPQTTKDTISFLESKGYKLAQITNYYKNPFPQTGYKGMHLNFISPYGQMMELQIHSEHSFAIKQEGHDLYEQMRAISTPIEIKEKLAPQIKALHSQVHNPIGIMDINNYRMTDKEINEHINSLTPTCVDIVKQQRDNINVLVYNISQNDKNIFSGSEIRFSDSSLTINRQYNGNQLCQMNLTEKGVLTNKIEREGELSINAKKLMGEAIKTEANAKMWMAEYIISANIDNPKMNALVDKLAEKYDMTSDVVKDMLSKFSTQEKAPAKPERHVFKDDDCR